MAKIVAGGLPGGAVGGRAEILDHLDFFAAEARGFEKIQHPGTFNANPVSAAAGIAPLNRASGATRGHRAIAGGRTEVRNVLYMAALAAIRWNPPIRALHLRLRGRGRPAKAALVAAMRKLLAGAEQNQRIRPPSAASLQAGFDIHI